MPIELPPWTIFTKAISLIWEKRLFALYISFPFILFHTLMGVGLDLGILPPAAALGVEQGTGSRSLSGYAAGLAVLLIFGFLLCVIAVYWHRSILLGEHPVGGIPVRFDGPVWRYVLYGIGMLLMWVLLIGLIGLILSILPILVGTSGPGTVFYLLLFPLLLWAVVVFFRFSLVLPAAAIGMPNFGFRVAWATSRGYAWRLVAILLLMFGLSIAIGIIWAVFVLVGGLPVAALYESLPKSLTLTLEAVLYAAQTLISIGVLSLTFAYLTYEGPRAGAVARK